MVALAGIAGCIQDHESEPTCGFEAIRLLDHIDSADIASLTDLASQEEILAQYGSPRMIGLADRSPSELAIHRDQAATRLLARIADDGVVVAEGTTASPEQAPTPGPEALMVSGPAMVVIQVRVPGGEALYCRSRVRGSRFWLATIDLPAPLEKQDLADARRLQHIVEPVAARQLAPVGPADANGYQRFDLQFRPEVGTRAVLVVAATENGSLSLCDFDIHGVSPIGEQLMLRDEFSTRAIGRFDVGADHREALLLSAPGTASFEVRLPTKNPSLRYGYAQVSGHSIASVRTEVSVDDEMISDHCETIPETRRSRWQDRRVDLSALGGRRVRITFFADCAAGAGAVAIATPVVEGDPAQLPPDVVLVSLDTVRADRMSLYGSRRRTTPFLEKLGTDSVVFDNAIAPANWTLPSHTTMFSGLLPDRHNVDRMTSRIDAERLPLLAAEYRARGFETIAVTGGGFVSPRFGLAAGFERFLAIDPAYPPQGWIEHKKGRAEYVSAMSRGDFGSCELMRILRAKHRRPVFLFIHSFVAHGYRPDPADLVALGAEPDRIPALVDVFDPKFKRDNPTRDFRLTYDATLRSADRFVRDIADSLGDGIDRTILVVTSDHGEELFEHGARGHAGQGRGTVFEEIVRIPLLIRAPGIGTGRCEQVVSMVDLAPTLRELSGLAPIDGDGRSLVSMMRGQRIPAQPAIARSGPVGGPYSWGLRAREFKLVVTENSDGPPTVQLFKIGGRATETVNVASSHPRLTRNLHTELNRRIRKASRAAIPGAATDLSSDLRAQLSELGYLGQ